MFQDITLEKWRTQRQTDAMTTIDVRSPSEFKAATIPGSINIPLFDDAERAEVGTIYKQVSEEAAKQRGLEIVSAKLPAFINQFSEISGDKTVFCWRGGMRSKTTATVLTLMGIHASRLIGGYRSYRQWVVEQLETMEYKPNTIVLQGNTGSGKTEILSQLMRKGYAGIDLEAMAGHRGSIFGGIGLEPNNQKMFEGLLVEQLLATQHAPYVVIEGESKRVGKAVVPDFVMQKKETGISIVVELPMQARVQQILHDYEPWQNKEACIQAFQLIKTRIHTPIANEIQSCLENDNFAAAVEMMLTYYYDPKYTYSQGQYKLEKSYVVKADSIEDAYLQVEEIISNA